MLKYEFPCGCKFDVINETHKDCDDLPSIYIDYYNIPEDCELTWNLIKSGKTKGIFQLETNLGKKWSKELLPTNIEEMSALISLFRPGCLRAIVDGKSMTQHYCDRKNKGEEVKYFHTALKPILSNTYGVLSYQEQSIKIAQEIAGFNLEEADSLRKGLGKKLPEVINKIKEKFIDGCQQTQIVTKEESEKIFSWIQEGQRYLFNKSHGICYGEIGYWTAYAKAHFPVHFFTAWLFYANEKMDPQKEMQQLVSDSKNFDIKIYPPSLKQMTQGDIGHFSMNKDSIYFGIGDIKKIGESHVNTIITNVVEAEKVIQRKIDKWTWYDFLIFFSDKIGQTTVNNLIAAGATDYMGHSRTKKVDEYNKWKLLTQKEREWIKDNFNPKQNLCQMIENMMYNRNKTSIPRKEKINDIIKQLKNPSYKLNDSAHYIASHEQELLGIPITCTKLDTCNHNTQHDTTCKEFLDGKDGKMAICVEIVSIGEYIIKKEKSKGKKMLFLQVEDETGCIESAVIFPNILEGNEPILISGNTVLLEGTRDKKYQESFVVEKVVQI